MIVSATATNVWTVFNDFNMDPYDGISISNLTWCSSFAVKKRSLQCQTVAQQNQRRQPHGVLGGGGIIHVVYVDTPQNAIMHTTYNMNTNLWDCNATPIGEFKKPLTVSCGPGSTKVLPVMGNNNLEFAESPRIARDPISGTLIVTWDSYDLVEGRVRSRAFVSQNGGTNWTRTLLTNFAAAHSVVAVGPNHRVEIANTHETSGNQAAQVRWKSTDGGLTWGGLFISASRNLAPVIPFYTPRPCFWGDYEGLTWHAGNDAFFHSWVDTNQPGERSVIRGMFSTN